jgi:diguanylate cyclase (GGDEF)-like protein/PAS domain S-box-containing protein
MVDPKRQPAVGGEGSEPARAVDQTEAANVTDNVTANMTRDASGVILRVGEGILNVLGWHPEQLVDRPSTEFIHPEDQPSAIAAWFEMIAAPGQMRTWQGRYRTSGGAWKWVECDNVNRLEDPDNPVVQTTMRSIAGNQVNLAEELRSRKQLLSRLSDAMPVGMFEIDSAQNVTFTNHRLHAILGSAPSTTVDALFCTVAELDRSILGRAIDTIMADEGVNDVELRFGRWAADSQLEERVCVLSMRPLTDRDGQVTGAVGCVSDVTEQVELRRQLELRANTDELTSCFNRSAILKVLSTMLAPREDAPGGTAVIFIDLCRFKIVNDVFGHAAGDRVLEIAADRLKSVVREGDQVGRFGGDEFLVVCPGVDGASFALELGQRVREALTDRVEVNSGIVELRASVGVAWSAKDLDADALVAQADEDMYEAKRAGSTSVTLFASSSG